MWCPFPLRAKIRECQRGSQPRYQQTNSKQTYQIEIKCTHEPKRRQALAGQVIVCGTQRPSIKSPPYSQETNGKKNKMEKQNVNMPTSKLSVEKFLRLFIYFRTLDFSTIASVSRLRCHLSTPHFTASSPDKVLTNTHTV